MTKERKILILIAIIVLSATILGIYNKVREKKVAREESKKVILINFWSSACPNCWKTIPHLNAWYEKYRDAGLEVIGVHTPQFDFEKDKAKLAKITGRLGIKYKVLQGDDYKTWVKYKNSNWPTTYLIDTNGFIVYKHIGEGAYDQIEKKIQELLIGKNRLLSEAPPRTVKLEKNDSEVVEFPGSPAFYFSHNRNNLLGTGKSYIPGVQVLALPKKIEPNKLYLSGKWNFQSQYAENKTAGAKVVIKYNAKEVYFVAGALRLHSGQAAGNNLSISKDGGPIIQSEVTDAGLYLITKDEIAGEHLLEITIDKPGLRAYVIEFR